MNPLGEPVDGKFYCLEPDVEGKYDLIIPKVIEADTKPELPLAIVRCGAGTHAVVDVDLDESEGDGSVVETRTYELMPYDDLERLATRSGRVVSMFLPNGLVRGAGRLEGEIFKPLGMLSAGQPRQRGTHLIQWDQYDFDDPRLLEKTLRLPADF